MRKIPGHCGVALALVLVLGACAGDDDEVATSTTTTTATSVATTAPVASTTTATAPPPTLMWAPCGFAECATLTVPLDHDDPSKGTIDLAVARRSAQRPEERIGVLLYNPGGPAYREPRSSSTRSGGSSVRRCWIGLMWCRGIRVA